MVIWLEEVKRGYTKAKLEANAGENEVRLN